MLDDKLVDNIELPSLIETLLTELTDTVVVNKVSLDAKAEDRPPYVAVLVGKTDSVELSSLFVVMVEVAFCVEVNSLVDATVVELTDCAEVIPLLDIVLVTVIDCMED